MDIEAVLRKVDEDLAQAQAELRAAQGRVAELENVRTGLKVAIDRYGLLQAAPDEGRAEVEHAGVADERDFYLAGNRMDMILDIVNRAGRPISTEEVTRRFKSMGRAETNEQIRSTLGYLKRVDKIERVGRGLWEPIPARSPRNAESPAATGLSGGDRSNSEDRSHQEGGSGNGAAHLRDQRETSSLFRAVSRDHGVGASVAEAGG
jgi:hypothetical protein